MYWFEDDTTDAGRGTFLLNGVAQPTSPGTHLEVQAADLSKVTYQARGAAGFDNLYVKAFDLGAGLFLS